MEVNPVAYIEAADAEIAEDTAETTAPEIAVEMAEPAEALPGADESAEEIAPTAEESLDKVDSPVTDDGTEL